MCVFGPLMGQFIQIVRDGDIPKLLKIWSIPTKVLILCIVLSLLFSFHTQGFGFSKIESKIV